MDTYKIKVGLLESLYLSDALSMFTLPPPLASLLESNVVFPRLLMKIGAVVVYMDADANKGGPDVDLELTAEELWVLREVAKSSVVVGSEKVGLKLLVKIYGQLLLAFPEHSMNTAGASMDVESASSVEDMLRQVLNDPTKEYEADNDQRN